MITPSFNLDQNSDYLFLNIRAPYANLNEVDLFVENNDLRFFCKPYYLRLNLPGNIIENNESGTYDFEEQYFKFKFEKVNKGEIFEGLDLLTKLLTPNSSNKKTGVLIEELNSNQTEDQTNEENEDENENEDDEEDGDQWYLEQNVNQEKSDLKLTSSSVKYGFAQTKSNIFSKLSSEYTLIIDNPDPDNIDQEKRSEMRIKSEYEKFDEDHYLADYFDENEMIESILNFEPYFKNENIFEYTDKEIDTLKSLPKKTYLLDKDEKFYAFCGLIDILYAYCYNNRINCGEKNVESGWTIAKLSSTLSWFDTFKSLEDCLIASFRRSLCFPLYRNWKLSKSTLKDLILLLEKGIKLIIKVLLEIRESFLDTDCRYILNDLYINDYCVWIQYVSSKKISNIVEYLKKVKITKDMVNFDLECVELAGKLAMEEDEEQSSNDSDGEEDNLDKYEPSDINSKEKPKILETKKDSLEITTANLSNFNLDEGKTSKSNPKIVELN